MTSTTDSVGTQVPGVTTVIDTAHATPEVVKIVAAYFHDKARRDVDASAANFNEDPFVYIDATLGMQFPTREALRGLFAQGLPTWPAGANSYLTRVVGDENSAIVYFTNDPGIFFPADQRAISVVNFVDGKIARWIDYWDANHIGAANVEGWKVADEQFPSDFGASRVGEVAAPAIVQAANALNAALVAADIATAAALFAPDATFVDLTAHVRVVGPRHIRTFLTGAQGTLPYLGQGVELTHVVGSNAGGGYEWTAKGVVPRGVLVLTLDGRGLITSLEAIWDGSRLDDDALLRLATAAIER
jgi:ketosteroid isomerase-like protein